MGILRFRQGNYEQSLFVFLAEDLGLEFHGLDFAPTGLGTYFAKHSQGDALGFRMAPRWGLGHCPADELGKGAIGGAGFESKEKRPREEPRLPGPKGERPRDEPRLLSPNGETPRDEPRLLSPNGETPRDEPRLLSPNRETPRDEPRLLSPNGETPRDEPRLLSPNGETPRDEPRLLSPNGAQCESPGHRPGFGP
jgi:hypothetical protein